MDVSADGGKSWQTAELTEGRHQSPERAWAWTFWEADVDLSTATAAVTARSSSDSASTSTHTKDSSGGVGSTPRVAEVELVCKAVDAAYNVQPDSVAGIWNLRGINNTAWHRKKVIVEEEKEDDDQ